jgi:hypothetical protein
VGKGTFDNRAKRSPCGRTAQNPSMDSRERIKVGSTSRRPSLGEAVLLDLHETVTSPGWTGLVLLLGRTCGIWPRFFNTRFGNCPGVARIVFIPSLQQSVACGRHLFGAHFIYRNLRTWCSIAQYCSTNPATRGECRDLGR